jgi:hypothetical protein
MERRVIKKEIKKGVVFGYLCSGRFADDRRIYRFGRSTKTNLAELSHIDQDERKKVAIARLGQQFGGLNTPEHIVMWEESSDVHKAWNLTRDYLHGHLWVRGKNITSRPKFVQEVRFGDTFFSVDQPAAWSQSRRTAQVLEDLREMATIVFRSMLK